MAARLLLLQRCRLQTLTVYAVDIGIHCINCISFYYKTILVHASASHIFLSLNEWSDSATVLLYRGKFPKSWEFWNFLQFSEEMCEIFRIQMICFLIRLICFTVCLFYVLCLVFMLVLCVFVLQLSPVQYNIYQNCKALGAFIG